MRNQTVINNNKCFVFVTDYRHQQNVYLIRNLTEDWLRSRTIGCLYCGCLVGISLFLLQNWFLAAEVSDNIFDLAVKVGWKSTTTVFFFFYFFTFLWRMLTSELLFKVHYQEDTLIYTTTWNRSIFVGQAEMTQRPASYRYTIGSWPPLIR